MLYTKVTKEQFHQAMITLTNVAFSDNAIQYLYHFYNDSPYFVRFSAYDISQDWVEYPSLKHIAIERDYEGNLDQLLQDLDNDTNAVLFNNGNVLLQKY